MSWTRFFRRKRWDAERASEIATHIQMEVDENLARGMPPEAARAAAQRKFGNRALVREQIYGMNSISLLEDFFRDVAYGLRNLRRSPGFTAVAILSLALGIGANTAIFSLVDTLMLKSLPVERPHELVQLSMFSTEPPAPGKKLRGSNSFSYPIFEEIRDGTNVFAGIFAHGGAGAGDILLDGRQERVTVERATGAYFSTLGVKPVLGRMFTSEQDRPGAEPVAVITYGYWQRRFGLDPSVLGKTFTAGKVVFTIIGVGPPRFSGISVDRVPDIWVPLTSVMPASRLWGPDARRSWDPHIVARLNSNVSPAQADAQVNVLFAQIMQNDIALRRARDKGRTPESTYRESLAQKVVLVPANRGISGLRRQYTEPLIVLLTVVGLVLLIACANIANLSLARANSRKREVAVRLAIGASRVRLIMQLLTESLMLSFGGALAGLLFAFWAGHTLVGLVVQPGTADVQYHLDLRVLGFTAGVAVLTGLLFGLGPALRATRVSLTPALKNEAAAARGGRMPAAKLLVVTQVALSLTLVLGAVLFVATLRKLLHQDLGFRADSVLVAGFTFDNNLKGQPLINAYRDLLDRANGLPGVQSATLCQYAALTGSGWSEWVYAETPDKAADHTLLQFVAPNFFDTMRMPIVLGRGFTARDDAAAPKVIIINEALARKLYPNGSAIGKRLGWTARTRGEVEIVGVVGNARYSRNLRDVAPQFAYLPMWQPQTSPYGEAQARGTLQFRAHGDPASLTEPVRRLIQEARAQPGAIRTQDSIIQDTVRQERLLAKISGFFGGIGLMLAAVGLYGLMAYTVSRRTSEMGIRMALGARPRDVVRMVLRESTVLVAIGVAAGTAVAIAATRLIESFLFGVTRTDPAMIAIAAALLMAVGLAAAWLPALRASRVSPMTALRHE